jgi:hypothetical protein
MAERILYAVHTIGIGDVVSFAPFFLLAMRKGYGVDIAYEVGEPAAIAHLLFPAELSDGRLRFIHVRNMEHTAERHYAVVLIGNRRWFGPILAMGGQRLGTAIPIPIQDHKHHLLFFYNNLMRPLLQLRGVRTLARLPTRERSVRAIVFEQLSEAIGGGPSLKEMVAEVRSRALASAFHGSRRPSRKKMLLVHIFREVPYSRMNPESLQVTASCLAERFPSHKVIALSGGAWERQMAEAFASSCKQHGLDCEVLSPSLEEVVRLAASTDLFISVDHGILHLASLVCRRSLVIYGGCRSHSDLNTLWPPQLIGEAEKMGAHFTRIREGERTAILLHPSHEEYLAQGRMTPILINRIVTCDNVRMALRLATIREAG